MTVAPRYLKPAAFKGTDIQWRVLCDLYPSAETPEVIVALCEYCAARRLDPLRKPVHVVPIWNSKLRRRVQVVMQGINELETTAHRTGRFAGADEADYGPDETKTFRGTQEDERTGQEKTVEVKLTYPVSASVTVWRLVQGQRVAFRERVFFEECYGRAGFRSEIPNARWSLAPRQMLAKVAKAASLRLAFPEEIGDYSAEEMDGHEVGDGGITIDGTTHTETVAIETALQGEVETNGLDGAHGVQPPPDQTGEHYDPLDALIAEIATMDLIALNGLPTDATWRSRVREAIVFPPDEERLQEAIVARKAALQPLQSKRRS